MTAAAVAAHTPPRPRLLFVDDEQPVLDAIAANLRRNFDVVTATSGAAGLERLREDSTIAVIVSDMRMPQMNGAAFLTQARVVAPNAVRMLLTGQTDLESAIAAVNKGQVFRFLTKPCPRDDLRSAVDTAVEQHRLQNAERELLEQTLMGSIKMLVDILALAAPAAFGRANRIKARVLEVAAALGFTETWQFEIAALASQLGYITLPRDLCDKIEHGKPLTDEERRVVARAPETTASMLTQIPRLELVCAMLAQHVKPLRREVGAIGPGRTISLGAHTLRLALDVDELETAGKIALEVLRTRDGYDAEVFAAFERVHAAQLARRSIKQIPVSELRVGMVFSEDVRLATGALLVSHGYEVTASFIERVKNFPLGAIKGNLHVIV